MLPKFLVSTYKQYKEDTKVLATWLSVTARGMGYVSEAIPPLSQTIPEPPEKSKTKSKQKTKKQLRDAARRIPKAQRLFTISQKEFIPLAQHIVAHIESECKVPSSILSMIVRIIEARKGSDEWFRANTREDDNDGHLHFIRILQEVYDILKPHVTVATEDGLERNDKLVDMDNLYEVLHIEEPSQEFLNAPSAPRPNHKGIRAICEFVDSFFEHVENYYEESFAASSLFKDINQIYRHVEQVWHQYKEKKVDLMTAAITSNTAIELIRRLEADFFEEFPRFRKIDEQVLRYHKAFDPAHRDAQQLINFMFRAKCNQESMNPSSDDRTEALFNLELLDDARYIFLDMQSILVTYYQGSDRMDKCVYQAGPLGLWKPDLNYQDLSNLEKHRQDRRILLELLPDMALLSTTLSGIHSLAEDELLRGSRNLFAEKKKSPTIHLWMLVSLRLFCDIHHVLGRNIANPFQAVRKLAENTDTAIDEAYKQRDSGKTEHWSEGVDMSLKYHFLDRMQQSLFVDEVKEYIDNAARNVKWWRGKRSFELLHRHPWACGLMEFAIRAGMHEVGLVASHQSESGMSAAHLYNALQKEGALQALWPDMELFIEMLGNDQVFRGDRPTKSDEYFTRLSLLRGLSAETFARNRRNRGILQSKRPRKVPYTKGDLLPILQMRYFMTEKRPELTDEDSTNFLIDLEEELNKQTVLNSEGTEITIRVRDEIQPARTSKTVTRDRRSYSPMELLMSLQFSLARELPKLMFDFLSFHQSCWEVLRAAYGVYGPVLEQDMGPVGPLLDQLQQHRLPYSVDLVLGMGVPLSKAGKMVRKVAMPTLPPVIHEHQRVIDQAAIFREVGRAVENKIANGRLRIEANVRARKLIEGRPEVVCFDVETVGTGGGRITINKHKMWQHQSSACNKSCCVCGVKPMSMLKSGWRRALSDHAGKILANAK